MYIGNAFFKSSVNDIERQYRKFYLREAKILAQAAENSKSTEAKVIFNEIQRIWDAIGEKPANEYVCIVDKNSNLLMHTDHPETVGNYAGSNLITTKIDTAETCLADL